MSSHGFDSPRSDIRSIQTTTGDRELRVKIGVEYHLKLQTLKLLRGQKVNETIEEALDQYFANLQRPNTGS